MKWAQIFVIASALLAIGSTGCKTAENIPPLECNHLTPLQPGIPGSPENLIMLENRPNGVSELAALMREMLEAMKETRSQLIEKKPITGLKNYERMKCAWPTDMSNRSAQYDAVADLTIEAIKNFNQNPTQDAYNTVVATCITCHQQRCPGPTAAIRPLLLNNQATQEPSQEAQSESCELPHQEKP